MLSHLGSAESYSLLHARFGVSRVGPGFWQVMDRMHRAFSELAPLEAGLFDLNRLEGR